MVRGDRNGQLKQLKKLSKKSHKRKSLSLFPPLTANHLTFDRNGVWQVEGLSICFFCSLQLFYGQQKTLHWLLFCCKDLTFIYFLVFILSGSSDIVQQIWALVGKKASLSCNIKPDDPNEQLATVLWYRGNQGEPIFT